MTILKKLNKVTLEEAFRIRTCQVFTPVYGFRHSLFAFLFSLEVSVHCVQAFHMENGNEHGTLWEVAEADLGRRPLPCLPT